MMILEALGLGQLRVPASQFHDAPQHVHLSSVGLAHSGHVGRIQCLRRLIATAWCTVPVVFHDCLGLSSGKGWQSCQKYATKTEKDHNHLARHGQSQNYLITCLCCIKWLGFQHPRHGTPQVPSFRPEELLGDLEFHNLQLLWSSVQPSMRHPQNYRPTKMVPEAVQYADKKSGWLFFSSRNKFLWL